MKKVKFPMTLYGSRWRAFWLLLGSLAFVATGWALSDKAPLIAYTVVIFFGLGALIAAVALHQRANHLRLEREGFAFLLCSAPTTCVERTLRTLRRCAWRASPWSAGTMWKAMSAKRPRANWSRDMSGAQRALPETFRMALLALAELMDAARRQAAGAVRVG